MTVDDRADARLAAADRGRPVPVRLHRQAPQGSFVEKTIGGAADVMRAGDVLRRRRRAARRCSSASTRGSSSSTLFGLLVARGAGAPHPGAAGACTRVTLVLAAASRLPLGFFVKRVWLFVPIFTGIVVLPATLNFITPGHDRRAARHVVRPPGRAHRARASTAAGLIVIRVAVVDLARRAAHAHDAVEPAARRRCGRCSCPACSCSCSAWPTATSSTCSNARHRHVHRPQGAHRRHATRDVATGPRVRRRDRPARCSARRTRSPRRCTWRWSRAATPATPARCDAAPAARDRRASAVARVRRRRRRRRSEPTVSSAADPLLVVDDASLLATSTASPRSTASRCTVARGEQRRAARRERLRQVDAAQGARRPAVPRLRHVHARSASRSPRTASRTSSSTPAFRSRVGFVFQNSDAQVFSPTVREEIAFGPLNMGLDARRGRAARRRHARDARHRATSPTARRTSSPAGRRSGSRSRRCS